MAAGSTINRADLAAVCAEALTNPGARNVTFEIVAREGAPPGGYEAQLKSMWASLQQDA